MEERQLDILNEITEIRRWDKRKATDMIVLPWSIAVDDELDEADKSRARI